MTHSYESFTDMTQSATIGLTAMVIFSPYTITIDLFTLPYAMTDNLIRPLTTKLKIKKDLKIWQHLLKGQGVMKISKKSDKRLKLFISLLVNKS